GLERMHLLGQSWGTILGVEYALCEPKGIASLILADPCLSIPRWLDDAQRLLRELPAETQAIIQAHEAAGTTDSATYQAAVFEYYKLFLCRLDPWPDYVQRTHDNLALNVYNQMWGPSEFTATGSVKEYDATMRLGHLRMPVLYLCGRYDEATPAATAWYQSLTPRAQIVIFENSAHLPHAEEPEQYLQVVRDFIHTVEASPVVASSFQ